MRIDLTQQAPNLTSLWKKGGGRRPEGSKQNLRKVLFKRCAARPIPQSQPRGRSAVTAPFRKGSLAADESQYVQSKYTFPRRSCQARARLSAILTLFPRLFRHFTGFCPNTFSPFLQKYLVYQKIQKNETNYLIFL